MTYGTDMTFEQRLAKIDLSKVMEHVRADTGMSDATLARAEDLYRKFLTLRGQDFDRLLVPPRIVDLVWHAHITFTRQYMSDCELLFGQFMHHNPTDDDTTEDFQSVTVPLFEREFGVSLYAYGVATDLLTASYCS